MSIAASTDSAPDGLPSIVILEMRRAGRSVRVAGSAVLHEGNVIVRVIDAGGETTTNTVQATAGAPQRGTWEIELTAQPGARIVIGEDGVSEERTSKRSTPKRSVEVGAP